MRCEGWRRYGSAFTLGGVPRWEQCKEQGTVMLTINEGKELKILPACMQCWAECIQNKLDIIKAEPVEAAKGGE